MKQRLPFTLCDATAGTAFFPSLAVLSQHEFHMCSITDSPISASLDTEDKSQEEASGGTHGVKGYLVCRAVDGSGHTNLLPQCHLKDKQILFTLLLRKFCKALKQVQNLRSCPKPPPLPNPHGETNEGMEHLASQFCTTRPASPPRRGSVCRLLLCLWDKPKPSYVHRNGNRAEKQCLSLGWLSPACGPHIQKKSQVGLSTPTPQHR